MALKRISRGQEKPRWLVTEESEFELQRDQVSFIQGLLPFLALKQLANSRDCPSSFIKYIAYFNCLFKSSEHKDKYKEKRKAKVIQRYTPTLYLNKRNLF